jgi:tetratricopeptide (TPR) repeat protein
MAGFGPLSSVTNGLSLVLSVSLQYFDQGSQAYHLQIAVLEKGRSHDFMKEMDRISFQAYRIAEIQKYPDTVITGILLEKTISLMAAVMKFLCSALIYFKHDYFYNLGKTLLLGPQVYADGKTDLNDAIAEYDQALLLQVTSSVLTAAIERQAAQNSVIGNEFLKWMKPSRYEVEGQLLKNRQLRSAGTLQWVLELPEFRRWRLANDDISNVLWFSGLPGIGKSILSAFLVDILNAQYPNAAILYFFVKSGEPGLDTVSNIIRTLAAQLAEADKRARQRLEKLMAEGFSPSTIASPSQLVQELIENSLPGLSQPLYVVLDGLDECVSVGNDKSHIAEFLSALFSTRCRVIVASRPTPALNAQLQDYPIHALGFEDNCNDIGLYVRSRVKQSSGLHKGFERLAINPEEYMLSRSNGSFLWVSIVLGLLEQTTSAKSFKSTLDTLPQAVRSLYDAVLENVESTGNLNWAIAILEWTLFSQRQLTLEELQIGIEKNLDDEILDLSNFIQAYCGMFLRLVPLEHGSQAAQIGHELFRSYITDSGLCKHHIITSVTQAKMAKVCLDVLSENSDASAGLKEYASRYWHIHLKATSFEDGQPLALGPSLEQFLKGSGFVTWIKHVAGTMRVHSEDDLWSLLLKVHHDIISWANSESGSISTEAPQHGEASEWTDQLLGSQSSYDSYFATTLASVWVSTLWDDWDHAHHAYMSALKLCRIFGLVGPETPPTQTWHTWKGPANWDDYRGTSEQIDTLAELGGYDGSVGTHCFNRGVAHTVSKLDGAEDLFMKALDDDPEYFLYHEALGRVYHFQALGSTAEDRYEKVLRCYEKAMKLDPQEVPRCSENYWPLLAVSRKEKGDVAGAIQAYRNALKRPVERNGEMYWHGLADFYKDIGDLDSAKKVYREAISTHPEDSWKYWSHLSNLEWGGRNWEAECEVNLAAIAYDPEYANNYRSSIISRASTFKECQGWDVACQILNRAIAQDEKWEQSYKEELADTYLCWGRWAEALDVLNDLASMATESKPFNMWHKIGDAHLGLEEAEKAISAYKEDIAQACSSSTRLMMCLPYLGRAYSMHGQHELAIREFKNAIRTYKTISDDYIRFCSKEAKVFVWLASTYQTLGRWKDAQELLQQGKREFERIIAKKDDDDTVWRSEAREHAMLGLILEELGDTAMAKEHYQKAVALFEQTTHVEDDEMEHSEHQEALGDLARMMSDPPLALPAVDEEERIFRLRRDLVRKRRTNWGVSLDKKPPRMMGQG